jgi:uncharacterized protein with PQ loop repeat
MDIKIELFISGILTLIVLLGTIRIIFLGKEKFGLLIGLLSLMTLTFGVYLWIKNGLTIEYGTEEQVSQTNAPIMFAFGVANILTGFSFITVSILKYVFWKVKKNKA